MRVGVRDKRWGRGLASEKSRRGGGSCVCVQSGEGGMREGENVGDGANHLTSLCSVSLDIFLTKSPLRTELSSRGCSCLKYPSNSPCPPPGTSFAM